MNSGELQKGLEKLRELLAKAHDASEVFSEMVNDCKHRLTLRFARERAASDTGTLRWSDYFLAGC